MTRRSSRVLLAGIAALALSAACEGEVSVGGGSVPEAEVEATAAEQLAEEVDQPVPDIDCPGDLDAEVGAELVCELSVEGGDTRYPVTITVTAVDEDTERVDFDVQVGQEPLPD